MSRRPKSEGTAQDMRKTILKTALLLFSTKGYFNTSIHDIRRTADISTGAIYHHFQSKEEIAKAIYDDLLGRMTEAFEAIQHDNQSTADRCRAIIAFLFEMTESSREEMEFMLYAKHREFMPSAIPICSSKPFAMMREIVQEGIDKGELRDLELTITTTCLFGAMFRMIHLRLDEVIEVPLPQYIQNIWESGWRSVALD